MHWACTHTPAGTLLLSSYTLPFSSPCIDHLDFASPLKVETVESKVGRVESKMESVESKVDAMAGDLAKIVQLLQKRVSK